MNNNENQKLSYNNNNMETFVLEEQYNMLNAKKILETNILDEQYKSSLNKYINRGKYGKVKVRYMVNDIGRLTIGVDGLKDNETCIYTACMWRPLKSALCSKYYYDLDIVNCHSVLLLQTYINLNYDCPLLQDYVNNRDKYFDKYKKQGIDRDTVKTLVMRLMYGGSLDAFIEEHNLSIDNLSVFKDLNRELKSNAKKLLSRNDMIKYKMKAIEVKGNDYHNINGTAMSYFLQTIECKCLMTMYKWLKSKGYKVGALIHDGLHIAKRDDINKKAIIKNLELEIQQKTGYTVDLKFKDFETVEELEKIKTIQTDQEGGIYISEQLKNDYKICNDRIFMNIDNVWTEHDKTIKRNLIKVIGNMDIYLINETTTNEGVNIKLLPYSKMCKGLNSMLPYVNPIEDPEFIDKLWKSNLYKLCFKNGVYDFKLKKLVPYDTDTHTTIKICRDHKPADPKIKKEVYDRVLNPIFNNDKQLMNVWLNTTARGLAGHIEDKIWGVGLGERNSGKGVLVSMLENCFGDYCRSTNSENFLFKKGQTDSAKSMSWLVPFEFKRLIITNEITIDSEGKYKINGNILKKLSSGGDKIEARVNHKDEINFKIQARPMIFCNDLPPIEPADTKETAYMFRYPSKFLNKGDDKIGKPIMRPKFKQENGKTIFELDEEGNKIMENVCCYYEKDDNIKRWCENEEVINAFIEILFEHYGDMVDIPDSMKNDMNDFNDTENDKDTFLSLFYFPTDKEWNDDKLNYVSCERIKRILSKAKLSLSPQKYKSYLEPLGCYKEKKPDYTGKRVHSWVGVQVNEQRLESMNDSYE